MELTTRRPDTLRTTTRTVHTISITRAKGHTSTTTTTILNILDSITGLTEVTAIMMIITTDHHTLMRITQGDSTSAKKGTLRSTSYTSMSR